MPQTSNSQRTAEQEWEAALRRVERLESDGVRFDSRGRNGVHSVTLRRGERFVGTVTGSMRRALLLVLAEWDRGQA